MTSKPRDSAPGFPAIRLEIEERRTASEPGFLTLERTRYRAHYPDGTASEPFVYDTVLRSALDAAVIVAHYLDDAARRWVYLRSAKRPPVHARHPRDGAEHAAADGDLWELPAGLVEASEVGAAGPRATARRELEEELGFAVELDAMRRLGPSTFPAPAIISERHYFFEVEVDPDRRGEPALDGSALERFGSVVALPLSDALELCRTGVIEDEKTELGLRRLAEARA